MGQGSVESFKSFLPLLLLGIPPGNLPGEGLTFFNLPLFLLVCQPPQLPPGTERYGALAGSLGAAPGPNPMPNRTPQMSCSFLPQDKKINNQTEQRNRCPTECQIKMRHEMSDRMSEKIWNMSDC